MVAGQKRALVVAQAHFHAELDQLRKRAETAEELVGTLRAQVAEHARQRFGRRSERQAASKDEAGGVEKAGTTGAAPGEGKKKGQRRGGKGHGRRPGRHGDIPVEEVVHAVPEADRVCQHCGRERKAMAPLKSDELDIVLVVRRVRHVRECLRSQCSCWKQKLSPKFVRAAVPGKVIRRGGLSTNAITFLVMARYAWGLPLHRIKAVLRQRGADLSEGTAVGVFEALGPLLLPLAAAIRARSLESRFMHGDETTWRMLWAEPGRRGWVWCFLTRDTVVYVFDEHRDHKVVLEYLGLTGTAWSGQVIDLLCDFMGAYTKAARLANAEQRRLELSRCWVHYRRLFLKLGAQYPKDRDLAGQIDQWLVMIGDLFKLHQERDTAADGSPQQEEAQRAFRGCLSEMEGLRREHLDRPELKPELRALLNLGKKHWDELTRCGGDPHHPIDNNPNEREVRHVAVLRKGAYGSGSATQAAITCAIWTIIKTAERNGLNPYAVVDTYMQACAAAGGKAPENLRDFLPCPPPSGGGGPAQPGPSSAPCQDATAESATPPGSASVEPPTATESPAPAGAEVGGRSPTEAAKTETCLAPGQSPAGPVASKRPREDAAAEHAAPPVTASESPMPTAAAGDRAPTAEAAKTEPCLAPGQSPGGPAASKSLREGTAAGSAVPPSAEPATPTRSPLPVHPADAGVGGRAPTVIPPETVASASPAEDAIDRRDEPRPPVCPVTTAHPVPNRAASMDATVGPRPPQRGRAARRRTTAPTEGARVPASRPP